MYRSKHIYLIAGLALNTASYLQAAPTDHDAPATNHTRLGADRQGLFISAAPKKKSGVKKRKKEGEGFGPEGIEAVENNDTGVGIHREQEGVDTPYRFEATGTTSLEFLNSKYGDQDPQTSNQLDINGSLLFLLGSIGIGPDIGLSYSQTTSKTTSYDVSGLPISKTVKTTDTNYALGPLFKYYFGNLDHDLNVPFMLAGVAYRTSSTKTDGGSATKSTGSIMRVGGGVNMFLDSNIALAPQAEYRIISDELDPGSGLDKIKYKSSGLRLLLSLSTFL